jgi:glycosyltransferase involved in cell wall biosynthesis
MQRQSLVRRAAEYLSNSNYQAALDIYKQLSKLFGSHIFRANILLCEKWIKAISRKDYANLPLQQIRVACVMDEFTFASYKDICTLRQLSIGQWQSELEQLQPDLLFIESAWRGKDDAWNKNISQASPNLIGALNWCKQRNIPTIFWNKEDPVHYGTFLNTAKHFDFVFTTDLNCIGNYKRDLGHDRVYLLPFGVNPVDHNPIEKYQRKPKACFAGSYYVRYPERIRDLDTILETFIDYSGIDIYDRNFGKEDVNYAYPDKYKSLILGKLKYEDIDLAYKGYEYGINLNSVKYSPSMFARRVFELLANRTLVVSNYSLGVRLLFGDLVISTDSKIEIAEKLKKYASDPDFVYQIKQEGLRKVMLEHTYEIRLSYIAEKVLNRPKHNYLPLVHVITVVKSQVDIDLAIENFSRQNYTRKKLYIFGNTSVLQLPNSINLDVQLILSDTITGQSIKADQKDFVSYFDLTNHYGPHYLIDLALATKYTSANIITKAKVDGNQQGDFNKFIVSKEYTFCSHYFADASLVSAKYLPYLIKALTNDGGCTRELQAMNGSKIFKIDRSNFFTLGSNKKSRHQYLNEGICINEVLSQAEITPKSEVLKIDVTTKSVLKGKQLYELLNTVSAERRGIICSVDDEGLKIIATTNAETPYYVFTKTKYPIDYFWKDFSGKVLLDTGPGLEIAPVVRIFDEKNIKLGHAIMLSNWNQSITFPANAKFCEIGIRVSNGPGEAIVKNWVFDHVSQENRFNWTPSSDTIVISANYPQYDDYYRYAFVHQRIKYYKNNGVKVDTFRFRQNETFKFYEFEGIDVVSGGVDTLDTVLKFGNYSKIVIHGLDQLQWDIVSNFLNKTKIIIYLHGAEIQSWKRRMFNYATDIDIAGARGKGEKRDEFWRSIFNSNHPNIHYVFVSNYFKSEVLGDLGITFNPSNIHIIHNPINTNLFKYVKKDPMQRKKILSIRPYASKVYANDLMVKAIIELSKRSFFNELHFKIVGDGVLFDEIIKPLKNLVNVEIYKGFLSQREIANLHREYGVFLCPTRMDTQGVSRDEAMASGLVPVTNYVGAVPEFLNSEAGFLCDQENHYELAESIESLYFDPIKFSKMSKAAADSVRSNRPLELICGKEVALLQG